MAEGIKKTVRAKAEAVAAQARERLRGNQTAPAVQAVPSGETGFRSSVPWAREGRATTLVITCSSSRFLQQTGEFLAKGLHLPAYDLVAVPGGIQWLALPELLPKHHKVERWVTEHLIRKHRLTRVVCIAHAGCTAYTDEGMIGSLAHLATGKTGAEHQVEQLLKVGRELRESFQVRVDLYYASVEDGTVVFHKVEEPPPQA